MAGMAHSAKVVVVPTATGSSGSPAAKKGGDPLPPSLMELLGAVDEPSLLDMAAKGESIS
jgi:hypothetical protein